MARRKREQARSMGSTSNMTPDEFANLGYTKELLEKLPATQFETNQITRTGKGSVSIASFEANAAGLFVHDTVTLDEINEAAFLLFAMEGRIQLWIGDLLNVAEQLEYGAIKDIAEQFNRDAHTLYNWKALSVSVKTSLRREVLEKFPDSKPLSKSHYELVQALEEVEQRKWLELAAENNWSIKALREAIASERNKPILATKKLKPWEEKIKRLKDDFSPKKWSKLSKPERQDAMSQLNTLLMQLEEMGLD